VVSTKFFLPGRASLLFLGITAGLAGTAEISRAAKPNPLDRRAMEARKACAAGRVEQGIELLAQIIAENGDPNAVFNQARCYQANGRNEQALARFREYLRIAENVQVGEADQVRVYIAELEEEARNRAAAAARAAAATRATSPAIAAGRVPVPAPAPTRPPVTPPPPPRPSPSTPPPPAASIARPSAPPPAWPARDPAPSAAAVRAPLPPTMPARATVVPTAPARPPGTTTVPARAPAPVRTTALASTGSPAASLPAKNHTAASTGTGPTASVVKQAEPGKPADWPRRWRILAVATAAAAVVPFSLGVYWGLQASRIERDLEKPTGTQLRSISSGPGGALPRPRPPWG
jgi:hypothetical protein